MEYPQLGIPAEMGTRPQKNEKEEEKERDRERRGKTGCAYSFHAPCSHCGNLAAQA